MAYEDEFGYTRSYVNEILAESNCWGDFEELIYYSEAEIEEMKVRSHQLQMTEVLNELKTMFEQFEKAKLVAKAEAKLEAMAKTTHKIKTRHKERVSLDDLY